MGRWRGVETGKEEIDGGGRWGVGGVIDWLDFLAACSLFSAAAAAAAGVTKLIGRWSVQFGSVSQGL